jgi:hypothetical protein
MNTERPRRGQSSGQLRGVASSRQRNLTTSRDPWNPRHPARQPGGLSYPDPEIKIHSAPRATTDRRSAGMNDQG